MGGCYAIIVAAGRGHRAGGGRPKQYRALAGRPLLRYSAATFAGHDMIDGVRVVIHPDDRAFFDEATDGLAVMEWAAGGPERQDSVRLGLESLQPLSPDRVLIHDAARPFVSAGLITRAIRTLNDADGALAALPVVDTLKREARGTVAGTVDRSHLWRAQTPQGFRFEQILAAHRDCAGEALTDDAAVAEKAGMEVRLVPGDEDNFKVTTAEDFARAEALLAGRMVPRVGYGYDVHRFGPGDHVWLCGVKVAHEQGLVGHSDADAGLHALTDAVLGALADGDIGTHFPPSDPQWKDTASDAFLRHAASRVAARGGRIVNLDATLICEAPRIGPHRDAMVTRVADIAGLPESRVSIKATTTERLGFTGRGEGIACQAVATLLLPMES